MRPIFFPRLPRLAAPCVVAASACVFLSGCETSRPLPKYERPLARTEFQTVRTTAYTHTEADHLEYSNHNALGGILHAAGPPVAVASAPVMGFVEPPAPARSAAHPAPPARALPVSADDAAGGFHPAANPGSAIPAYAADDAAEGAARATNGAPYYAPGAASARGGLVSTPPMIPAGAVFGSAAADWSRWPAGTIFRVIPTGQLYKVDDYGWALSGRNTIDLYMPTRATMNAWGVRGVPIQIVQWGDRDESLRILRGRQKYRHLRRMVLELEGKNHAAAALH